MATLSDDGEWECQDESLEFSLDGTEATGSTDELGPISIIYNPPRSSDGGDGGDDDNESEAMSLHFHLLLGLPLVAFALL